FSIASAVTTLLADAFFAGAFFFATFLVTVFFAVVFFAAGIMCMVVRSLRATCLNFEFVWCGEFVAGFYDFAHEVFLFLWCGVGDSLLDCFQSIF
ncbi:MAG: hypothetical protein ACI9JZ_000559, partial [Lentimonas sp.]